MSHKPVTHSQPIPMPRQSGLLERKGRFYLNMRVPKDLRAAYGKKEFIRKSLGTTDRREAISLVRLEAFKADSEFSEARRRLKSTEPSPVVQTINEREMHNLVFGWFIELEKLSEDWWDENSKNFDEQDRDDVLSNLRTDEVVYSGGSTHYRAEDGSFDLDTYLKKMGMECPKDSPAYRKLVPLFTKARLEHIRRTMDRVTHRPISFREPLFRDVFAHTELPSAQDAVTVGKLLDRYVKYLTEAKRSAKTLRTYSLPCRLLREELGEKTSVQSITKEKIERLFDLLRSAPKNVTQRYPGLTLQQAIAAAQKNNDQSQLSPLTLSNYFTNIVAIFNFAVDEGIIAKSPTKGRLLRASFTSGPTKPKELFTVEQLNRLFRTSPFNENLQKRGRSRKAFLTEGRAWLPLLALFHGFRCNEVAQLYTEDVKTEDGIPFIEVREEREDGSKCDKRLKTKQSKRRVPLHPEVLKMGFLSFVKERRSDNINPRLFSDLPRGATGYYSDPFSKWFGRFINDTLGEQCKATFHSFRHLFRDALTEAGVPLPDVERLGGWKDANRSAERDYGHGPSLKRLCQQIQTVKFPKLNLKHLRVN